MKITDKIEVTGVLIELTRDEAERLQTVCQKSLAYSRSAWRCYRNDPADNFAIVLDGEIARKLRG